MSVRTSGQADVRGDPRRRPVPEAIDRLLRLNQEIAKIMGLYAPTRTETTHITLDAIDAEIQALEAHDI